jgi:undecaprenyl phosphate-alpha-L-ara4FN deformylase
MDAEAISQSLNRGVQLLTEILGRAPTCSAVPGWKCNDLVLLQKSHFPFRYNSDCRGRSIFSPVIENEILSQPQIPVTLPTYDEVIGSNGVTHDNYNEHLFSLLKPDALNVLTIHAEVEGIVYADMFGRFVEMAGARGVLFKPLGELIGAAPITDQAPVIAKTITGREGWIACQAK